MVVVVVLVYFGVAVSLLWSIHGVKFSSTGMFSIKSNKYN